MSSDEPYDADGDVSRFLQCPGPDSHLLPGSEPEGTQHAPPPAADVVVHGHLAPQAANHPANIGFHAPAAGVEHEQHQAMDMDVQQQHHAPAVDMEVEHHQAFPMDVVGHHHQTPAVDDVHHHHHQAMSMGVHIQQPQMMAAAAHQQAFGFQNPTAQFPGGGEAAPWFQGNMIGDGVIPPPSPAQYQQFVDDGEQELAANIHNLEISDDAEGGPQARLGDFHFHPVEEGGIQFVPFVPGQLDCSRCRSVREILHRTTENCRIHLIVHAADPGTFQHVIIDRTFTGADGQEQSAGLVYLDLRNQTHEWVSDFTATIVEMLRSIGGQLQDTCSTYRAAVCSNSISAPLPPSNQAHMELEINMLRNILSAPAATTAEAAAPEAATTQSAVVTQAQTTGAPCNYVVIPRVAEAAAAAPPEAAQPAVQAQGTTDDHAPDVADEVAGPEGSQPAAVSKKKKKKNTADPFGPFDWEGFRPYILESSLVKPYDPASGVSVITYPSLEEKKRLAELEREERKRLSQLPVPDTTSYLHSTPEDTANKPDLSSTLFRLLCQKDSTYRLYARRIKGLNKKMEKLEETATRVGTSGLFALKQKMDSYKHEKAELYARIKIGLEENEMGDDGAGPSNYAGSSDDDDGAGPSNSSGPSSAAAGPSNAAGPSDAVGPSNGGGGAGCYNTAADLCDDGAGGSSGDAGASNGADPSGSK